MRQTDLIIKRVQHLDSTLVWHAQEEVSETATAAIWALISTDTQRVVAKVTRMPDGFYKTGYWKYDRENDSGNIFENVEAAQEAQKAAVIRDILEGELRRDYIQ